MGWGRGTLRSSETLAFPEILQVANDNYLVQHNQPCQYLTLEPTMVAHLKRNKSDQSDITSLCRQQNPLQLNSDSKPDNLAGEPASYLAS